MDGLPLDSLSFPQPISSEPSPQSLTPSHFHQIGTHCLLVQRNIQEWQVFWNHNTAYYASQLREKKKRERERETLQYYTSKQTDCTPNLWKMCKCEPHILTFDHGGGSCDGCTAVVQFSSSEPSCPRWSWQSSSPSHFHELYIQRSFLHWRTKTHQLL